MRTGWIWSGSIVHRPRLRPHSNPGYGTAPEPIPRPECQSGLGHGPEQRPKYLYNTLTIFNMYHTVMASDIWETHGPGHGRKIQLHAVDPNADPN